MQKLNISENGRYFIKEDGTPFSWLADTAWTIPQRMKWDDVDYYMKKRKEQGFTVLQIVALDSEGAFQMKYVRAILDDLHIMKCIPAQELLVDSRHRGEQDTEELKTHIQVCRDLEETYLCAYLPSGGAVQVKLHGIYYCWWLNPRDGKYYDKNGAETEKPQSFTFTRDEGNEGEYPVMQAPTCGDGEDWILILHSEAKIPVQMNEYYQEDNL